jgi:hypothetical protein
MAAAGSATTSTARQKKNGPLKGPFLFARWRFKKMANSFSLRR